MALLVSDDLWLAIEPLLPPERPKPKGGRPQASDRAALAGILFVLRTSIQWHEVPAELSCCGKTCWRRLGGKALTYVGRLRLKPGLPHDKGNTNSPMMLSERTKRRWMREGSR